MPGLVGVYDARAGKNDRRRIVDRMCAADAADAVWQRAGDNDPGTALCGVFQPDDQCVAHDRDTWLVFAGELYNRNELQQRLRARGDGAADGGQAALCLALLSHEGESFVRLLNGQFNIVIYRGAEARLSIATDRVGYRPLFIAHRGDRLLFATAMKAVLTALEIEPSIDGIGLLQTMRCGWPLGRRTWLGGIEVADPGTWLHVDAGGLRQERYFRLQFAAGGSRDVDAHAEGLATALAAAVRRTTDDGSRFAIPLSGGLDSRAILLTTTADRRPSLTYTFGRESSLDVDYARRLAAIVAVPHRDFRYEPGYLGQSLEPSVRLTEGLIGFPHPGFTSIHFHDRVAEKADVILYGHGGDCLTGAHLRPSTLAARSVDGLIAQTFRQYNFVPEPILRRVFNESFYRRHTDGLLDALRVTFQGIEGDSNADVADVWDMENRQRRGTFVSCAVDRGRFEVRAPFLDNDVVDYLLRVPLRRRILQLGYKHMLVSSFGADAAAVPWAYTGKRLQATFLGDFVQHAWNYGQKRLLPAARDLRQFRDLAHDTRRDPVLARRLEEFVRHPDFPGDILDRGGVEEAARQHWSGQNDLTHLVIMLITFATAWRLFMCRPAATASMAAG